MAVKVEVQLRQKGGEDVSKAVNKLRTDFDKTRAAIDNSIKQTAGLKRELKDIGKALDTVDTAAFRKLDQQIDEVQKSADQAAKSIRNVREEGEKPVRLKAVKPQVSGAEARRRAAFEATDPVGDVDTAVSAFAGAFGQFGGAGVEQATRGISDVLAISEAAPRMVASLATISPAMLATTGALGAGAIAFYAMSKAAESLNKKITEGAEAARKRAEAEVQTFRDTRSGSLEAFEAQAEELQVQLEASIRARTESINSILQDFGDEKVGFNEGQLTEAQKVFTFYSLILSEKGIFDFGPAKKAKEEIGKFNEDIADTEAELARINTEVIPILRERAEAERELKNAQELGQADAERFIDARRDQLAFERQSADDEKNLTLEQGRDKLSTLKAQLEDEKQLYADLEAKIRENQEAINAGGLSESDLAGLQQQNRAYEVQLQSLSDTIVQSEQQLESYEAETLKAIEKREQEERALSQLKDAQSQRNELLEKEKTALNALKSAQQALVDFEAQVANEARTKAQEKAIRDRQSAELDAIDIQIQAAQAAEKQAQAQQKLSDLELDRNAKLNEVLTKGRDEEQRRQDQFGKELERFARDTALQARRIFRDTGKAIDEAVASNDVVAFANAIEERNKSLSDLQEDADIEAADRIRDFNDESIRLTQDREQQLQQIRTQFEQQRLQIVQQSGSQELTLVEQLQRQRALIVARHQQELENFRIRQEVDAINRRRQLLIADINSRQQEYDALRRQGQQNAFNIARSMVLGFFSGLSPQQQQAQQAVSNFGSQAIQQFKNVLPKFGHGGLVKKPTVGLLGERPGWMDLVIPVKKSDGAQSAIAGRGGVTIHINNPSITSESELNRIANHIGNKVVAAIGVA